MSHRILLLAYVVPAVLAVVLGFVGLLQVAESGAVGSTGTVTASAGAATGSNERVAAALERVARTEHVTIVRFVADRTSPVDRRAALTTGAPGTRGATWLRAGYPDFSRGMSTRVEPMAALVEFDPTGTYELDGTDRARSATVDALRSVGYEASSDAIPLARRLGMSDRLDGTLGLVGLVVTGAVVLCLVGTVGAPRRYAVQQAFGRSSGAVLLGECSVVRALLPLIGVAVPTGAAALWWYNRLADVGPFVLAVTAIAAVLLLPVIAAHGVGVLAALRVPMAAGVRGARPTAPLVALAQVARFPAVLLLVAAVFDLVGATAVARSGSTDRDLRAAGASVQLWVTPDPRPVDTQEYWDRIGDFAASALVDGGAILAAPVEVPVGGARSTVPVLFVDDGYLRLRDVRASDGSRVSPGSTRPSVWLPDGTDLDGAELVRALRDWDLRNAAEPGVHLSAVRLADGPLYTFPGDATTPTWLDDAALVVVPDPARAFTPDQLGSWLSSGDVVFRTRADAERSITRAGIGREFSAVVDVGQAAAEEARHARLAVGVGTAAVVSGLAVAVSLSVLATAAHRRRSGRRRFVLATAGASGLRADLGLFAVEFLLVACGAVAVVDAWVGRRPDGTGLHSGLDPVARAADPAALLAAAVVVTLTAVGAVVIGRTARTVVRERGAGAR